MGRRPDEAAALADGANGGEWSSGKALSRKRVYRLDVSSVLAAPIAYTLSNEEYGKSFNILDNLGHEDLEIDAYVSRATAAPRPANVHVHESESRNRTAYYVSAFREVNRQLTAGTVDLYHHMNLSYRWFNPVLLANRQGDIPVVIGPAQAGHRILPEEFNRIVGHAFGVTPPRPVTDAVYRILQPVRNSVLDPVRVDLFRRTLQRASKIIAVHEEAKQLYAQFVDESKLTVIPLGVDPDTFTYTERSETMDIVAIGSLRERKAYDDLLDAMNQVVGKFPDVQLHVFGEGPLEANLKAQSRRLGIADSVTFHGYVDQAVVRDHLQSARAFVHPSISESFSLVRLEAMATGCPVIVSDISGAREMVRDGRDGFVVPTRSPDELADAMTALLADLPLARRMGASARQRVEERYDWAEIGRQYLDVYQSLL